MKAVNLKHMLMFKVSHSYTLALTILVFLSSLEGSAQQLQKFDSIKAILNNTPQNDSVRLELLIRLSNISRLISPDSGILYGTQAVDLAYQINSIQGQINSLGFLSFAYYDFGDLPKALGLALKAYQLAKDNHAEKYASASVTNIGYIYLKLQDFPKALHYFRLQALIGGPGGVFAKEHLAEVYLAMNQLDSASYYASESLKDFQRRKVFGLYVYAVLGDIALKQGNLNHAIEFYKKGLQVAGKENSIREAARYHIRLARYYIALNQLDSSIYYAKKAFEEAGSNSYKQILLDATSLLSSLYESTDTKQALHYYKLTTKLKEELIGAGNIKTIQNMIALDEENQRQINETKKEYERQLKQYGFIFGLLVLAILAIGQYRNNIRKQKANALLLRQKEEIQSTLTLLKSTQSQLIQSEKMASLGELTAGIAHEIQNPLNFVNNFSEVSNELMDELKTELATGNRELATEIANDIASNLEKINHHGKRADAIVKGMLQHSRTSTGQKELTDINSLCDEYLRLSYHGLRAKDKSFNAKFETDFDSSLPKINVIPQDIGRVILNLINNAFYAVNERLRQAQPDKGYEPLVKVITKNLRDKIQICVQDNGSGIPEKVKEKIFQPFFTTKPTGQGTGLGLSLSYDIVKAHGGEIKIQDMKGEGAEFIIMLPFKSI
ncbi:MAG TPA: two-component sensor histidine kinase [Cytophagales bacterium]|jgi:two-component system, NtrC family, sensor kinase|nr:two-component sensor histidine kinase [Cytophagales bacterium]